MVFSNNLLMGAAGQGGGYTIDQSIRFNAADSSYLTKTFGADGGDTWTFSLWIKRSEITSGGNWYFFSEAGGSGIGFVDGTDKLRFYNASSVVDSTQVFRDVGGWYHFVFSNNAGTVTITVNNTAVEIGSTTATLFNRNNAWHIGSYYDGGNNFDGYLAEINWVDGTALAPTDFGETNDDGVWIPKRYSGAYGTNGFYITGEDSADLGADYSGNGNDFTSSGLATTDQMLDTPTDNFPTFSNNIRGLESYGPSALTWGDGVNISDGGLKVIGSTSGGNLAGATMAFPSSGKYYFEATFIGAATSYFGISPLYDETRIVWYRDNGWTLQNATSWTTSGGATYTNNDVLGVSVNMDDLEVKFYKNNALQITISLTAGVEYIPTGRGGNNTIGYTFNFGASAFTYTPPTGFVALSTANLPTPTIADGTANFQTTLYTGNGTAIGSGGLAVSQSENSTFQPDLVWIKERNGVTDHALYDAVRGTTKDLASNNNSTETTETEGVTTFGSAGFTVGNLAKVNTSSDTYVAWQWKANGSGSSNEDGTINTTATSANTTAGFSMSTYTGNGSASQTVGHGLGVTPSVVLIMPRSNGDHKLISNWESGVTAFTEKMKLNDLEAASSTGTTQIIGGSSTTFTIGTDPGVNGSSRTYVAYCWAEVEGYSKFGTYIGNGSADGPFGYTGFKPAWILIKCTNNGEYWHMFDSTRDSYNVTEKYLYADEAQAETTYSLKKLDLLSNGVKLRGTDGGMNTSGSTYVFMAFAENPFGGDGVAPATAR